MQQAVVFDLEHRWPLGLVGSLRYAATTATAVPALIWIVVAALSCWCCRVGRLVLKQLWIG
jgi:hypothetical protein